MPVKKTTSIQVQKKDSGTRRFRLSQNELPKVGRDDFAQTNYGSVTIVTKRPSKLELTKNVAESAVVIRSFGEKIAKCGIKLRGTHDIPRFSVYNNDPSLVVRELKGKKEHGKFVNGKFKRVAG
jgi:hypothetical protein